MIEQAVPVFMYVIRYERNGTPFEAICRGSTPEAASARYLKQLRHYGVDISGYSFISARQLKELGKRA